MAPDAFDILIGLAINAGLIVFIATTALLGEAVAIGSLLCHCARTRNQFDELHISHCQSPARWIGIDVSDNRRLSAVGIP